MTSAVSSGGQGKSVVEAGSDGGNSFKYFLLLLLLFISGFCGISYEVLYGRMLADIIGDQFQVSSAILLTFLLGIGIGNRFAYRFWGILWLIEAGIGLYAMLFVWNMETVEAVIYDVFPRIGTSTFASLSVAVSLLLVPAFFIGASLAIFAGYVRSFRPDQGYFAKSYGIYNFGAAVTVLMIEFWLIRQGGIKQAVLIMGGLNVLVSLGLLAAFRATGKAAEPRDRWRPPFSRNVLLSLALCSFGSAIFQLVALRLSEMLFGPFRETFAYVLCIILLGIAIGSVLVNRFAVRYTSLLIVNMGALCWTLGVLTWVMELYADLYALAATTYWQLVILKFACIAAIALGPAITFGATIPALLYELGAKAGRSNSRSTANRNAARESGYLLFVSSIANVFGFLAMSLYLHERFDYGELIMLVALLTGLGLFVFCGGWRAVCYAAATLFVLSFVSVRFIWNENLLYFGHETFRSKESLGKWSSDYSFSERFKSEQDVFAITRFGEKPYFFINGYFSIPLDTPVEKLVGAIAAVFSSENENALVLGVGSGATASTVGLLFDHTEAVEINRAVLDNLFRMKEYNFDIEKLGNVDLHHDDAIHYVKSSNRTYSLILNTVTTPLYFSSSKLYTADFLDDVQERLKPGGIYVTWVDTRVGDPGIDIMLETVTSSFDHCGLAQISNGYLLLLCSNEPIVARQPHIVAREETLNRYFTSRYHLAPDWIAYQLLHTDVASLMSPTRARVNTLDFPVLEFEMAQLKNKSIRKFQQRIVSNLSLDDISGAFSTFAWDPIYMLKAQYEVSGGNLYSRRWKDLIRKQSGRFPPRYLEFSEVYGLGMEMAESQQYERALVHLERAAQLDSRKFGLHMLIGKCYEELEQYERAMASYRREAENHPFAEGMQFLYGRLLVKQGKYELAVTEFRQMSGTDEAQFYYYFGRALEGSGNPAEAATYYSRAVGKNPALKEAQEALDRLGLY